MTAHQRDLPSRPSTSPTTKKTSTMPKPMPAPDHMLILFLTNQSTASGRVPMTAEIRTKIAEDQHARRARAAPPNAGASGSSRLDVDRGGGQRAGRRGPRRPEREPRLPSPLSIGVPAAAHLAAAPAGGGDLVEDGAEAGVVALAGEVEQAGAGADALEVDLVADAAGDGGLGRRGRRARGVVGAEDVDARRGRRRCRRGRCRWPTAAGPARATGRRRASRPSVPERPEVGGQGGVVLREASGRWLLTRRSRDDCRCRRR